MQLLGMLLGDSKWSRLGVFSIHVTRPKVTNAVSVETRWMSLPSASASIVHRRDWWMRVVWYILSSVKWQHILCAKDIVLGGMVCTNLVKESYEIVDWRRDKVFFIHLYIQNLKIPPKSFRQPEGWLPKVSGVKYRPFYTVYVINLIFF